MCQCAIHEQQELCRDSTEKRQCNVIAPLRRFRFRFRRRMSKRRRSSRLSPALLASADQPLPAHPLLPVLLWYRRPTDSADPVIAIHRASICASCPHEQAHITSRSVIQCARAGLHTIPICVFYHPYRYAATTSHPRSGSDPTERAPKEGNCTAFDSRLLCCIRHPLPAFLALTRCTRVARPLVASPCLRPTPSRVPVESSAAALCSCARQLPPHYRALLLTGLLPLPLLLPGVCLCSVVCCCDGVVEAAEAVGRVGAEVRQAEGVARPERGE